ncbi:hypothetical protein RA279_30200, partial [Pseudomonas syringae pv. tagetis]|uniref:hypothetical protein n=1 Tax=Pseudomonas syringae group genomosp. 7 TaxID=251699 RepID=UPI00376F670D
RVPEHTDRHPPFGRAITTEKPGDATQGLRLPERNRWYLSQYFTDVYGESHEHISQLSYA